MSRDIDTITEKLIGCAIEVHKHLSPGLLESIYEQALMCEMDIQKINYQNQVLLPVQYKGHTLGDYRIDLLVEDSVIVELKAVDREKGRSADQFQCPRSEERDQTNDPIIGMLSASVSLWQ